MTWRFVGSSQGPDPQNCADPGLLRAERGYGLPRIGVVDSVSARSRTLLPTAGQVARGGDPREATVRIAGIVTPCRRNALGGPRACRIMVALLRP